MLEGTWDFRKSIYCSDQSNITNCDTNYYTPGTAFWEFTSNNSLIFANNVEKSYTIQNGNELHFDDGSEMKLFEFITDDSLLIIEPVSEVPNHESKRFFSRVD